MTHIKSLHYSDFYFYSQAAARFELYRFVGANAFELFLMSFGH